MSTAIITPGLGGALRTRCYPAPNISKRAGQKDRRRAVREQPQDCQDVGVSKRNDTKSAIVNDPHRGPLSHNAKRSSPRATLTQC